MNIKNIIANIDKVEAGKKIVRTATAMSVGKVAQNSLRNNIPESTNPIANFAVSAACYVGGAVVAGFALEHLGAYSDKQIDEFFASFRPEAEDSELSEIVLEGPVL
jgi:hypothetical protein